MRTQADYETKAREMTDAALDYSIRDLQEVLTIWRDKPATDPAMAKWLAEFDAYTAERQRRQAPARTKRDRSAVAHYALELRKTNRILARDVIEVGQRARPKGA